MKTIYQLVVRRFDFTTYIRGEDPMSLTHLCCAGDKAEIKSDHDFNGVYRGVGLGQLMATYDGSTWVHYEVRGIGT